MTHFGLICPPAAGHLNPISTLGYELKKRGHQVTLFGVVDVEPVAVAAGLDFYPIGVEKFPTGVSKTNAARLGELSGLPALLYTIKLFYDGTKLLLDEGPKAIRSAGVEVLIVDQTSAGGETVAQHLEMPFITVCAALMMNLEVNVPPINTTWGYSDSSWSIARNKFFYFAVELFTKPIQKLVSDRRRKWNLPKFSHPNDYFSPLLQLSQQPAEFEFPRKELPEYFHFTGPYHSIKSRKKVDFPWEKLNEKPLIYASLGTMQNKLIWVFEKIAEACQDIEVQLVISLGGASTPESLPKLSGNPIVVGYAPQLELLEKAALTITHAGLNTALESLSYGVPMVAIPIANDQPGVAARIKWTGTGEFVNLSQLNTAKLKNAIEKVLNEPSYQQNAIEFQKAIQNSDGVNKAANIIEETLLKDRAIYSK